MTEEELLKPKYVSPYSIQYLGDALNIILDAIDSKTPITIVGDYDADGITSTTILLEAITFLGGKPKYRLPKRISEGYGISMKIINEIPEGLIITVDNGITAIEEVAEAKCRGLTVLVLDHHMPREDGQIPAADFVVDPHIYPDNNGYEHYCGAGLALKLTEMALEGFGTEPAKNLLKRATALAAIGTIADVMPLTGDNRRIVKDGLYIMEMDKKCLSAGLRAIMEESGMYAVTETDIGFKIGPLLNAPGRMYDDGAGLALETLCLKDRDAAVLAAAELVSINEMRKNAVADALRRVEKIIADQCLYGDVPLCVIDPAMPEGIAGVVTGRLAEQYKVPAFVFSHSSNPDVLKGSGRSYGDVNLKSVVDYANMWLKRSGGHAGAAGLSVTVKNYPLMVDAMSDFLSGYEQPDEDEIVYDLEIEAKDIKTVHFELSKFAPFGEGNPAPVFRINDVVLSPRAGNYHKFMGKNAEHLKLLGNGFSAVCFGKAEEYRRMGLPRQVSLVGNLSENVFQYAKEIQVEAIDFTKTKSAKKASSLMEALKANGVI